MPHDAIVTMASVCSQPKRTVTDSGRVGQVKGRCCHVLMVSPEQDGAIRYGIVFGKYLSHDACGVWRPDQGSHLKKP